MRSKEYLIEFNKLKFGLNEFSFTLGDSFLKEIDYSPLESADVNVRLNLIKTETLYDLKFDFKGSARVVCDSCAEEINIPIDEKFGILMKLSEANNFDDPEIIYIARTEIEFDLKQYLYESLLLAVPQRKGCDAIPEPKPCNKDMLDKIAFLEPIEEKEDTDEEDDSKDDDPRWNKLKDLLN